MIYILLTVGLTCVRSSIQTLNKNKPQCVGISAVFFNAAYPGKQYFNDNVMIPDNVKIT